MYKLFITTNMLEPTKVYVGMTGTDHLNYKGSGDYLQRAFKKYGKENFIRVDLGEFEYKDEANYWEGFYINVLKTLKSQGGYNISPKGGLGVNGCHSEETKRKMSESHKGKGKPLSKKAKENIRQGTINAMQKPEIKSKMSESHRDFSGSNNPMFGKHLSEQTKLKIKETKMKNKINKSHGLAMQNNESSNERKSASLRKERKSTNDQTI